jgi:guanylate kinase
LSRDGGEGLTNVESIKQRLSQLTEEISFEPEMEYNSDDDDMEDVEYDDDDNGKERKIF